MPPKPAAGVVVLTPREKIREDIEPLVTMYRNLGSDSAAAVVNRSISDLGMELAGIADRMILHDLAQVRAHFPLTLLLARELVACGPTAEVLTDAHWARAQRMHEAFDEDAPLCAATPDTHPHTHAAEAFT